MTKDVTLWNAPNESVLQRWTCSIKQWIFIPQKRNFQIRRMKFQSHWKLICSVLLTKMNSAPPHGSYFTQCLLSTPKTHLRRISHQQSSLWLPSLTYILVTSARMTSKNLWSRIPHSKFSSQVFSGIFFIFLILFARVQSRESFCLWVCDLHNNVNQKVGLDVFKCDLEKLDERWKHGADDCNWW